MHDLAVIGDAAGPAVPALIAATGNRAARHGATSCALRLPKHFAIFIDALLPQTILFGNF
jgi:hypothetical protein